MNNFINTTRSHNHVDQGDVRIDYKATRKDRLYGRISEAFQDNPEINSFTLLFDTFNQARLENGTRELDPQFQSKRTERGRSGCELRSRDQRWA